jgi:hypothetical protein
VDSTTIVVKTQVWNTSNKFGGKVLTEKEELQHYDHPPIEKLCYYLLSTYHPSIKNYKDISKTLLLFV